MSKNFVVNSINGIWNSYGCPPESGKSVSIYIEEPQTSTTASLAALCKFESAEKEIGKLASYKEISEIIVMLPMIQQDLTYSELDLEIGQNVVHDNYNCEECAKNVCIDLSETQQIQGISEKLPSKHFYFNNTENAFLFKIEEKLINKILNVDDYKKYSIYEIKKILNDRVLLLNQDNNIVKLMYSMINYYIPPHLNWLLNKDIPPTAFYTAEFKTILNKTDLSNIWQGTMPGPAINPQEDEIVIEHFLSDEEIFANIDLQLYEDIKLSVFKCKKKAINNYDTMIAGNIVQDDDNWYGFNWPYDNFSLVELLQIQQGEVHDYKNNGDLVDGVLKEERSKSITVDNAVYTTQIK